MLNDRGLELSPSDIVKSYINGKYEQDDETGKQIFNNNWKNIEDLSKQYEFKIDDFVVFYEYYKLKSNPKRQVVDELREIIQKSDVYELVAELNSFSESLRKVYESKDASILSLRYIPYPCSRPCNRGKLILLPNIIMAILTIRFRLTIRFLRKEEYLGGFRKEEILWYLNRRIRERAGPMSKG